MVGKKVRLTKKLRRWYFTNEAYGMYLAPGQLETDEDYDLMIENMLLMEIFDDEYPGLVLHKANTGNYYVKFLNGHTAYFEPKNLINE